MVVVFFIPFTGVCQSSHKPQYGPSRDKHRNKKDELDRKQGLWKHYNYIGTLTWEVEYLDNRRHGISKRYYGNGRIMRETEYQYGFKDGSYKRYDFDGVITEGEYVLGRKTGHWTNYYSNGQIKNEGVYVNGHKNGAWKYYNSKGKLLNTHFFKNGVDMQTIPEVEKMKSVIRKAFQELDASKNYGSNSFRF